MKSLSYFSLYLVKPLCIAYSIEFSSTTIPISYIEVIYESERSPLAELKALSIESKYSIMQQLSIALTLLNNFTTSYINPNEMVYMNTVKFIPTSKTSIYSPPEILQSKGEVNNSIVYNWTMCFYLLLLDKSEKELERECKMYKLGAEEDYKDFLRLMENGLRMIGPKNYTEMKVKNFVIETLLEALKYKPNERPIIKEVANSMLTFSKLNNFKVMTATDNKKLSKLLMLNIKQPQNRKKFEDEKGYGVCAYCLQQIKIKVEFTCEHMRCKNFLVRVLLTIILQERIYVYHIMCLICRKTETIKLGGQCVEG
jgi:hypothetical protein